jgi:hypothetical protein
METIGTGSSWHLSSMIITIVISIRDKVLPLVPAQPVLILRIHGLIVVFSSIFWLAVSMYSMFACQFCHFLLTGGICWLSVARFVV